MTTLSLLAASDSSDGSVADALWLLGPVAGVAFYAGTYIRYRNVDKRHEYERETSCVVGDVATHDRRTDHVSDVERTRVPGDNSGSPRERLGSKSTWVEQ